MGDINIKIKSLVINMNEQTEKYNEKHTFCLPSDDKRRLRKLSKAAKGRIRGNLIRDIRREFYIE